MSYFCTSQAGSAVLGLLSLGVLLPVPAAVRGWLPCLQPVAAAVAVVQIRGLSSVAAMGFKACLGSGSALNLESSSSSLCGHDIRGPTLFSSMT